MNPRLFQTPSAILGHSPHLANKSRAFQDAYYLLCQQDLTRLNEWLEKGRCLNIHEGIHTPVTLIASQRAYGTINWILDHLPHLKETAAIGYAQGNDRFTAENSLKAGESDELTSKAKAKLLYADGLAGNYGPTISDLNRPLAETTAFLEGFAESGHIQQIEKLLTTCYTSPAHRHHILIGLAKGGHMDTLNEWLTADDDVQPILFALGEKGHNIKAINFSNNHPCKDPLLVIVQGLAFGGHMETVDLYLNEAKKNSNPEVFERLLWEAIQGYGEGGHFANPSLITRALCHVADTEMRLKYANMIQTIWAPRIAADEVCSEADSMRALMSYHHLSYEEALPHYHPLVREANGQGLTM